MDSSYWGLELSINVFEIEESGGRESNFFGKQFYRNEEQNGENNN